jgi:hypothetical protein
MESVCTHPMKFRFWLGFEVMEQLAKELGVEELFNDESIADRITRGIPRKEVEELESVSISYPRVPQILYPSERSDGINGQHLNLTQLPQEIEIAQFLNFLRIFTSPSIFNFPTPLSCITMSKS